MNYKAIILVAGKGTRLQPMTLTKHKCLTEVNGIPIIENALRVLSDTGIKEVVLVVGYLAEQIKEKIGYQFEKVSINYVENEDYSNTNTSYSLLLGIDTASDYDSLFVLEGDVFFERKIMDELMQASNPDVSVLEAYNCNLDGTFATLGEDGYIKDWRHKSKQLQGYYLEDKYKTVNIHKFSPDFISRLLRPELVKCVDDNQGRDPLENVMFNIVSSFPESVKGLVLSGEHWCEIDDVRDLKLAEKIFCED